MLTESINILITMDKYIQTDKCSGDSVFILPSEDDSVEYAKEAGNIRSGDRTVEERGDGDEEKTVAQFYAQLSNVLRDARSKVVEEVESYNAAACSRAAIMMSNMKIRHGEEQANLIKQLRGMKVYCDNLESCVDKRDMIIRDLVGKLEYQEYKLSMAKIFNGWRRYAEMKKRKTYLSATADRHYKQILQKRMFHHWRELLKVSWKKHIELEANVEILEAQKQVVNLYENKIRNLEDTLSEAGRKIDTLLQNKLKPSENLPKAAPPKPTEILSSNSSCYQTTDGNQNQNPGCYRSVMMRPQTSPATLCADCSSQAQGTTCGRYFTYSAAPPVSYFMSSEDTISEVVPMPKPYHPSSVPQTLPVMGTPNVRHQGTSMKKNTNALKPIKSSVVVERHIPRNQVMSGLGHGVSMVSHPVTKSQSHKKVV